MYAIPATKPQRVSSRVFAALTVGVTVALVCSFIPFAAKESSVLSMVGPATRSMAATRIQMPTSMRSRSFMPKVGATTTTTPMPSPFRSTSSSQLSRFSRPSVKSTTRSGLVTYAGSANVFMDTLENLLHQRPLGNGKLKTAVITGASSGLGLQTTRSLIESGDWHVVMAVRNPEKARLAAERLGFPKDRYSVVEVELSSLESVRKLARKLRSGRQIDTLICNAALYLPAHQEPKYTPDGYETSFQVNHLSHFLLVNELMPTIKKSRDPRIIIVGSITGNTNTVGGGAVWPWADLGKLNGLAEEGAADVTGPAMIDGGAWNGAKAYKDSKLANMMTILEAHRRYHDNTGITFSTMYPGCVAETGLFRDKKPWFRKLFPLFMRYVTGGYVSEVEAGDRLAEVASSEKCKKSGIYWGWNGAAKTVAYLQVSADPSRRGLTGAGGAGGSIQEIPLSPEARNEEKARRLWELSAKAVGLPYDASEVGVLPETAAEIAAKNGPKSLPGIPMPSFVPDFRGKLDKRAAIGTSSEFQGGRL